MYPPSTRRGQSPEMSITHGQPTAGIHCAKCIKQG
uniref:Uncharacterized protein n=1 Tax=Siphoviridae sp. ct2vX3 TaxID=2825318 RepID=A0A8S5PXW7_9CAUD|nr:MAG TPA: hypothetical protein [Siphoviridae sp. ct2vX3]